MSDMIYFTKWWAEYVVHNMPDDKTKATMLIDRTDFVSENSDVELVKNILKVLQDNYPERLYRCIVYPSGFVFFGIWNLIKFFLDPVTQEKVLIIYIFLYNEEKKILI